MRTSSLVIPCAALSALFLAPSASAQCETQKIQPGTLANQDAFGRSISVSSDTLVVGTIGDDTEGNNAGAVYVFNRVSGSWVFAQKISNSDSADNSQYGNCSAVLGDTMLIGNHINGPGKVYYYKRTAGVWNFVQTLTSSDGQTMWHFGHHLDLDANGTTVVIGQMADGTMGTNAGAAYIFELVGGTWVETEKLYGNDIGADDRMGRTVSISGDFALVGADRHAGGAGAAYVFKRNNQGTPLDPTDDTWPQVAKLQPAGLQANDNFGLGVAIDGTRALVGALNDVVGTVKMGSVYVFEEMAGVWTEVQRFNANDGKEGDSFGAVVRLVGDQAVIGARDCAEGAPSTGALYYFQRKPSGFMQSAKFTASDAASGWIQGDEDSISLFDNEVVSGTWAAHALKGAAYVYKLAPDAIQYCSCASAAPCGNTDSFGGCRNSTGQGAVLFSSGSSSCVTNDFKLETRFMPHNVPGIYFMGGLANQAPFADGQLCIAAGATGIFRYAPAQTTGPNGFMALGPGVVGLSQVFATPGQIGPGETWHFQTWFRDPSGPCGNGSNTSNAVRMMFTP